MRRWMLLAVLGLATACGGAAETVTAPTGPRALATPTTSAGVDAQDSDVPRLVEDGVATTTIGTAAAPPAGIYDANDHLGSGTDCGRFFENLTDAAIWNLGDDAEDLGFLAPWFGLLGVDGDGLAARFEAASIAQDFDALPSIFLELDEAGLEVCGEPAGGNFFAMLGAAAVVVTFCPVDEPIHGDDDFADDCTFGPVYPDTLPCLAATGATWADLAAGSQLLPWATVDCVSGASTRWSPIATSWE